jgi:hypothetical protein
VFQYTVTAALLGSYVARLTSVLHCFVNKIVFVVSKEEEVFQFTVTAALLGSCVGRRTAFLPCLLIKLSLLFPRRRRCSRPVHSDSRPVGELCGETSPPSFLVLLIKLSLFPRRRRCSSTQSQPRCWEAMWQGGPPSFPLPAARGQGATNRAMKS